MSGERRPEQQTLVALVGQVGEVEVAVAELADDRDVLLARVVAVEARLTRAEALVRELLLRANELDAEVDRKAAKAETARLEASLKELDATCSYHFHQEEGVHRTEDGVLGPRVDAVDAVLLEHMANGRAHGR